jgi:hypothetical protein
MEWLFSTHQSVECGLTLPWGHLLVLGKALRKANTWHFLHSSPLSTSREDPIVDWEKWKPLLRNTIRFEHFFASPLQFLQCHGQVNRNIPDSDNRYESNHSSLSCFPGEAECPLKRSALKLAKVEWSQEVRNETWRLCTYLFDYDCDNLDFWCHLFSSSWNQHLKQNDLEQWKEF